MIASDEYRPRKKNTSPRRENPSTVPVLPDFELFDVPSTLQADLDALYYLQHKPDVLKGKYGKPFSTMGLEGRAGIDRIKSRTKAVIKRWRPN